jgi:hypothetical protein
MKFHRFFLNLLTKTTKAYRRSLSHNLLQNLFQKNSTYKIIVTQEEKRKSKKTKFLPESYETPTQSTAPCIFSFKKGLQSFIRLVVWDYFF